jgi:hypothetical protein
VDIAITVEYPKLTQFLLHNAGFPVPDPGAGHVCDQIPSVIPPAPVPAVSTPPPAVTDTTKSPVGEKLVGGSTIAVGDHFVVNPGWNFLLGQTYRMNGVVFQLDGGVFNAWWQVVSVG